LQAAPGRECPKRKWHRWDHFRMTRHRYSVVMMTYNQQDFVADAISAVLRQECPPLEVLISDDNSTDATFERIEGQVAGYSGPHRIILNRNPVNLGITAHLNSCFRLCSGDLLIAASGDDVSMPGRMARIIEAYEKDRPLLIHSRVDSAALNGGVKDPRFNRIGFLRRPGIERIATSMSLYIGATAAWDREIVTKYGDLPERDCYEDLIFGFRAALEGRVSFIDEELVEYRVGSGVSTARGKAPSWSGWSRGRRKDLRRTLTVLRERLRNARTFGLPAGHPVSRAIRGALALAQARLNLHEERPDRGPVPGPARPVTYVRAAVGELLSYRNARRRGL